MRTPVAALVLCLGAALAGCSDDGSAAPAPLPTVASPTAAPVPSPPALASEETVEGAEAFARYYFETLNAAFAAGDPAPVRRLTAVGCEGCEALIGSISELKSASQRRLGGQYVIRSVAVPPLAGGDVVVEVNYERPASQIIDEAGTVVEEGQAVGATNAQMRLIRRQQQWVVQGYRVVSR